MLNANSVFAEFHAIYGKRNRETFDDDVLTECFKGIWHGWYAEILDVTEANGNRSFFLAFGNHAIPDWNCAAEDVLTAAQRQASAGPMYAFDTLEDALAALALLQRLSVSEGGC